MVHWRYQYNNLHGKAGGVRQAAVGADDQRVHVQHPALFCRHDAQLGHLQPCATTAVSSDETGLRVWLVRWLWRGATVNGEASAQRCAAGHAQEQLNRNGCISPLQSVL